MKKYNPDAICIKCGCGDIQDEYMEYEPSRQAMSIASGSRTILATPDHIARTCKNCGYRWDEGPMDNTDKLKSEDLPDCLSRVGILDAFVIQMGDVVRDVRGQKGTVIAKDTLTGMVSVHVEHGAYTPFRCYPLSALTLIRKGPKVIDFGSVEVTGLSRYIAFTTPMAIDDGKYSLTATEVTND